MRWDEWVIRYTAKEIVAELKRTLTEEEFREFAESLDRCCRAMENDEDPIEENVKRALETLSGIGTGIGNFFKRLGRPL